MNGFQSHLFLTGIFTGFEHRSQEGEGYRERGQEAGRSEDGHSEGEWGRLHAPHQRRAKQEGGQHDAKYEAIDNAV